MNTAHRPRCQGAPLNEADEANELHFGVLLESEPPRPERMLAFLEGWMIYGTDHWFVAPSFWNSLPPDRQKRILEDNWDAPPHNCFKLDYTIFDFDRSA